MSEEREMSREEIAAMREEYGSRELRRSDLANDPVVQFERWFAEAREVQLEEPNALVLSTLALDGYPASRTVLMKFFDASGFVFYTNYGSAKAKELDVCAKAAMLFPWLPLERQVRVEGDVEKVSVAESMKYFASRPRESQIGAWVSDQSSVIDSRSLLMNKFAELRQKFKGGEIPLPSFWGGYRVRPLRMEFWQGGKGRVHDRFLYSRQGDGWAIDRLAP
ncbi:pyridoxamine 5'-phosphate oxidase [Verrucomicrobiaceae bacterium N1E253]|uniref:Pyridoxamine 5'-phosphate oxidase n=1 Tax=Oceaniferula marina TaxID=2748318 RepID=A0A851GEX1_9BACT|nr:pyridoxamine 5'-phosphate oxidase [Oceaniferula marina]NWK56083.1 pyridoxamine 5'-phosphate oxidase [Oceaniferula marina]